MLRYMIAGSWLRKQPGFGDQVSAHQANPSVSQLLSCYRGKRSFSAAKQSAPESDKAPGLASGNTNSSSIANKNIARVMGRCMCLLPSPKMSSGLPATHCREV